MPDTLLNPDDYLPKMVRDIPRVLGYGGVAELTPRRTNDGGVIVGDDGFAVPLKSSTISSYLRDSIAAGSWRYVPKPDIILVRAGGLWLPGWDPETIYEWQPGRPGAGNYTRGPERRGGVRTTSSGSPAALAD